MTNTGELLKDDNEYIFPSVPVNLKSGAFVPISKVLCSAAGPAKQKLLIKVINAAIAKKISLFIQGILIV